MKVWKYFKLCIIIIFLTINIVISFSQNKVDVIYLNKGGKIIGNIIEKTIDQSILCQLQSGDTVRILWHDIKEISELHLEAPTVLRETIVPIENSIAKDSIWCIMLDNSTQYANIILDSLKCTELYITTSQIGKTINIDSIQEIGSNRKSKFLMGMGIGVGAGIVYAAVTYQESSQKKTGNSDLDRYGETMNGPLLRIVAGGLIGALIGLPIGIILDNSAPFSTNFTTDDDTIKTIEHIKNIFNTHR